MVILHVGGELLSLSPESFFEDLLLNKFRVKGLVEVYNFRFGRRRLAGVEELAQWCRVIGIPFQVVPPFMIAEEAVSSSRIREAITRGDVKLAADCLGRPYRLRGIVSTGAKRGRTLGFPTANLEETATQIPDFGVYACRAILEDGTSYVAATNLGPNPTFGENARKVEVHLLDFQGDIYGQRLAIDFIKRLRGVEKFASVEALTTQLRQDIARTREIAG